MADRPKIIILCGPTGSGKTSVAIDLARRIGGEIVGADSMQIYRYMDIGTAKPTRREQALAPHHMIDIVDPDEHFDAARFARMASSTVTELKGRERIPLIVGGTGFYIKALVHGLFDAEPVDRSTRDRLKAAASRDGVDALYRRLDRCDPEAARRIHPNDAYRIIRALEIFESTGKTLSRYHREHGFAAQPYRWLKIGLQWERPVLYDRINRRVDRMVAGGLLQEVRELLSRGYTPDLKSMQSIGYRHMIDFLRGKLSWEASVQQLKRDTRRYAKRQFTWFRADPDVRWIKPDAVDEMCGHIAAFLDS